MATGCLLDLPAARRVGSGPVRWAVDDGAANMTRVVDRVQRLGRAVGLEERRGRVQRREDGREVPVHLQTRRSRRRGRDEVRHGDGVARPAVRSDRTVAMNRGVMSLCQYVENWRVETALPTVTSAVAVTVEGGLMGPSRSEEADVARPAPPAAGGPKPVLVRDPQEGEWTEHGDHEGDVRAVAVLKDHVRAEDGATGEPHDGGVGSQVPAMTSQAKIARYRRTTDHTTMSAVAIAETDDDGGGGACDRW